MPLPRKTARRWRPMHGLHYLTFSCYHQLPLMGNPLIRDEFATCLERARVQHGFGVLAWVAMIEHVHMIVAPTMQAPLATITASIKKSVAQRILRRWRAMEWEGLESLRDSTGRLHFWEWGGGFDRNVRSDELDSAIIYIHMNPVRRGLATNPVDWAWSSARWYARRTDWVVDIDEIEFDGRMYPGEHPDRLLGLYS